MRAALRGSHHRLAPVANRDVCVFLSSPDGPDVHLPCLILRHQVNALEYQPQHVPARLQSLAVTLSQGLRRLYGVKQHRQIDDRFRQLGQRPFDGRQLLGDS